MKNLHQFKPKWKNGKTTVIRIPEKFKYQTLTYVDQLDRGIKTDKSLVTAKLANLLQKIENKEKGYKSNSASALINDLKELIKEV